jgi:hypothetical protein
MFDNFRLEDDNWTGEYKGVKYGNRLNIENGGSAKDVLRANAIATFKELTQ